MKKITPFLWFNDQAEEAAKFYVSVFKNSMLGRIARYSDEAAKASGRPAGSAMTVSFKLNGQEFTALNGGTVFSFTPAISFVVPCETQREIDWLWEKLTDGGGEPGQCGWLKDKYGVSWQIVPAGLGKLLQGKDTVRARRVMKALLAMTKIETAKLKAA